MEVGEILVNMTEIINSLPPHIVGQIGTLITILKAVSIAFIVYVIYLVVKMIISWKGMKRLKFVEKKVKLIDKKLDILLKDGKKKEKMIKKK